MIEVEILQSYLIAKKISNHINKLNYLSKHLLRCIRYKDKIRLTEMIVIESLLISIYTTELIKSSTQMKDKILKI